MGVARMEPEHDAAAALVEHRVFGASRPAANEPPVVEPQPLRRPHPFAAQEADIRFGRFQVVPISLGFDTDRFDWGEVALDPEQALDIPLGLLVPSFAEMVVANNAVA